MSSTSHAPGARAHASVPRAFVPRPNVAEATAAAAAQPVGPEDVSWAHLEGARTAAADAQGHHAPSPLLESVEAREALKVLQAAGQEAPAAADVRAIASQTAHSSEHTQVVRECRDALTGLSPAPEPQVWAQGMTAALGHHPPGKRYVPGNVTAYVFLVMLQAQKEAINEKRESLRTLKMHAGMLEDLNAWVARVVVPAQRSLNLKIKQGQFNDSLSKRSKAKSASQADRVEEPISIPEDIDTQWGAIDAATGKVFIPDLAKGAVVLKKLDAQEMASLITQTDQWRATMQNHQNKQSMDFKRIDDAMASTWNMLSAFLKSAQEGTNAIIRNGVG